MPRALPKPGAIVTVETGDHVSLRKKLLTTGEWALFLAINRPGEKREYRFIGLRLNGKKGDDREALTQARAVLAAMEAELRAERFGGSTVIRSKVDVLAYFDHVRSKRRDVGGVWASARNMLVRYQKGPLPLNRITSKWVEGFRDFLLAECVGQNTAGQYLSKLTAMLNQAVREDLLPSSPARKVARIRRLDPDRRFLTLEELQALASTPCQMPDLGRAFLFCCYVGLRYSDVLRLTWSQIRDGNLYVRMKKTKDLITVPIAAPALAYLPERGKETEAVFQIPLQTGIVSRFLKRWAAAAGVAPFTFHTSRHTFATQLLTHGVDIYTVSKLLGHTDLASTQIYARVVDEKKRAAVDMLPAIRSSP